MKKNIEKEKKRKRWLLTSASLRELKKLLIVQRLHVVIYEVYFDVLMSNNNN